MAKPDKFADRYEKEQQKKATLKSLVSPDDPPLPEGPVEQAQKGRKTGRNDKCPCGSGKKYKVCCGKAK